MLEYVDLLIAPTSIPVMACRENEGAEVNSADDLYIDGSSWANPCPWIAVVSSNLTLPGWKRHELRQTTC